MPLALLEDRLEEGARLSLPATPRVIYVVTGAARVEPTGRAAAAGATSGAVRVSAGRSLAENAAWHGTGGCVVHASAAARLWRWELREGAGGNDAALTLSRAIDVPAGGALMRCDRVDFPPRGIAYTHTHQGPGIRVLLRGRFRVETNGHVTEVAPGEAWFERGPDPVYAESIADEPTSFVRVMILSVALLGKSSIRYVKAEDQARPKSQTYTVFVDAPLPP